MSKPVAAGLLGYKMPKFEQTPNPKIRTVHKSKTEFERLAQSLRDNGVIDQGEFPEQIDGYQFTKGPDGIAANPSSVVVGEIDMTIHQALPKPNVDTNTRESDDWTVDKVRFFFCNPIYAGLGPFPQIVDDETWVRAAAKSLREDGPEQWLVNMLHVLRASMGPELSRGPE